MRKYLNKLMRKSGYEIQKIGKVIGLLEKLAKTKKDIIFIQVGANDGVSFDNIYPFFVNHPCKGLVIEPLPTFFERLRLNYKDYPRITPLNVALHPSQTECQIYTVRHESLQNYPQSVAGIASFNKSHLLPTVKESDIQVVTVQCRTLMALIHDHQITELDYLQVDTEGFDYEVIKMIDFSLVKPKIIKFESIHLQSAQKAELYRLLANHGYKLIKESMDTIAYLP